MKCWNNGLWAGIRRLLGWSWHGFETMGNVKLLVNCNISSLHFHQQLNKVLVSEPVLVLFPMSYHTIFPQKTYFSHKVQHITHIKFTSSPINEMSGSVCIKEKNLISWPLHTKLLVLTELIILISWKQGLMTSQTFLKR